MNDKQRISNTIRDPSPCSGCTERFLACQDRCPKDDRGEYGIKAWKAELDRVKKAKLEYLRRSTVRRKGYIWRDKDG